MRAFTGRRDLGQRSYLQDMLGSILSSSILNIAYFIGLRMAGHVLDDIDLPVTMGSYPHVAVYPVLNPGFSR